MSKKNSKDQMDLSDQEDGLVRLVLQEIKETVELLEDPGWMARTEWVEYLEEMEKLARWGQWVLVGMRGTSPDLSATTELPPMVLLKIRDL
jgi:hypothetical protein